MTQQAHHYFASSVATWCAREDIRDVIELMEREPYTYAIYFVPLPFESDYKIKYYAPDVEGCFFLGAFEPRKAKKKAA